MYCMMSARAHDPKLDAYGVKWLVVIALRAELTEAPACMRL